MNSLPKAASLNRSHSSNGWISRMDSATRIMRNMAAYQKLDEDLVALIYEQIEEINDIRYEAQISADQSHRQFLEESRLLGNYLEADDRCPVRK